MRQWIVLILLLMAATSAAAQAPSALYMTDEDASTNGVDAQWLSPDEPTGQGATHQFSPLADTPQNTYDWITGAPETDDLVFTGEASIELFFDAGLDAASTTTVSLIAIEPDGTERVLGTASDSTPAEAPPHQESFAINLDGEVLAEGEALLLRVAVTETAVVVQLKYGGADSPSGITALPNEILDSDGDGTGDSAERRAGTDPDDAADTPGASETNSSQQPATSGQDPGEGNPADTGSDGGSDGASDGGSDDSALPIEAMTASFFLLFCLAIAGLALLGRFSI